jgi:predicted deacetylase
MIGRILTVIIGVVLVICIVVLIHRQFAHREIDDVHPRIMDVSNPYLQKSEWVWVIPLYMNDPVSNYPEWVDRLKKTGKKIGLHGVYHTSREFNTDRSDEYIDRGINEFAKAFGFYPTYFKAPSLVLTKANERKLRDRGIKVVGTINQILHKAYHVRNGKFISEY